MLASRQIALRFASTATGIQITCLNASRCVIRRTACDLRAVSGRKWTFLHDIFILTTCNITMSVNDECACCQSTFQPSAHQIESIGKQTRHNLLCFRIYKINIFIFYLRNILLCNARMVSCWDHKIILLITYFEFMSLVYSCCVFQFLIQSCVTYSTRPAHEIYSKLIFNYPSKCVKLRI